VSAGGGGSGSCMVGAMGAPFRFATPVRFADVDHAGIVYYPVFYHYFHLAFEEFFRARMGPESYLQLLERDRIGFPAVRSECDFKAPLRFGDTAVIEMQVERIGTKSVTFGYRVAREKGDVTSAEGKVVCAVTDLDTFRAVEVPERLVELFLEVSPDPR
jgi:4-hydroxybenzoyl-CoA thioesterase